MTEEIKPEPAKTTGPTQYENFAALFINVDTAQSLLRCADAKAAGYKNVKEVVIDLDGERHEMSFARFKMLIDGTYRTVHG